MRKDLNRRTPLLIALVIFVSISGFVLTHTVFADIQTGMKQQISKLVNVAKLVQMYYVEDIDWDQTVAGAISGMLSKMDPHSVYISAQKVQENKESFNGEYEGIGIQYDLIDDYLTVIAPIPGSPSYRLGIMAGDRIVEIDGKSAIGITQEEVPKKLKGPKGSTVTVTIRRDGVNEPLKFTITRDVIPIFTVTANFMVDDSTGYISVNRFAATTSSEVEEKLIKMEKQGLKRLILDLRWNSGGYLHEAVKLAGKFIKGHKVVVYTKGRSQEVDEEYYSDQYGRRLVRDYPLVVLVNRGSASASEIVAGAIQDFDRGLIVGENSFGKGLVQKEFPLQDGSAVRLTTAKYYTPSGRCIQRDYKGKSPDEYYSDIPDSSWLTPDTLQNRPVYYTENGRVVYGGGGIQPDVYVQNKNVSKSPRLTNQILQHRLFFEFSRQETARHPELHTNLRHFKTHYEVSPATLMRFKALLREKEIAFSEEEFNEDADFLKIRLKAEIARRYWDNNGYYFVLLDSDSQFQTAIKELDRARQLAALE